MNQSNHSLVSTYSIANLGLVDLDSASQLSGMHPEMILEVARAQLVFASIIDVSGDSYFDCVAIARLRLIEHLRVGQRAHMRTIRLIIQLTDRAESAERDLHQIREQFSKVHPKTCDVWPS